MKENNWVIDMDSISIIQICNANYYNDGNNEPLLPDKFYIKFDDCENDSDDLKAFDSSLAKELLQYINNNINSKKWIIHCSAGISRSGAVGLFIHDYLKFLGHQVKCRDFDKIRPNAKVLRELNNLLNKYE